MSIEKVKTAKEYLQQIYKVDCEINNLIEEKASYQELAEKITQSVSTEHVQASGTKDKIGELAVKIADKEYEIVDKIDSLFELKQKIGNEIKMLQNEKYRKIIILRHVRFMKFADISEILQCNLRNTYKLYNRALEAFSDVLSESDKN